MKQIIVNWEHLQTRVAFVEDEKMVEYYFETAGKEQIVSSIYKGRITNLEPSLQAAFIDLGIGKNAFLHYWDMIPATKEMLEGGSAKDSEIDEFISSTEKEEEENGLVTHIARKFKSMFQPEKAPASPAPKETRKPPARTSSRPARTRTGKPDRKFNLDEIPKRFATNSEVIVQVTKGPIGTKGPRVTANLSIPGRYVVLLPNSNHRGVSKRIADRKERTRLRGILKDMSIPKGIGVICRTASTGMDEKTLKADIKILVEKWKNSQDAAREKPAPCCIYEEPDLFEKTIRDSLTDDVSEIVVDSKEAYDFMLTYAKKLNKKDQSRVKLYDHHKPIFQHYKLTDQIQQIYKRSIILPSGAELCVDETEALIAIDINSRKSRRGKDHPETILNTNLEAAEEICRQLRLRNIGGLVIIDFIDMRDKNDRLEVFKTMKDSLAKDRAKTKIIPISKLGLLEMTRQREYESLQDATFKTCEYCEGRGLVKSSITISVELQRRLQEILRRHKGITSLKVTVHPSVLTRLKNEDANILEMMEKKFGGHLTFRGDPNLHQEDFKFINLATEREI